MKNKKVDTWCGLAWVGLTFAGLFLFLCMKTTDLAFSVKIDEVEYRLSWEEFDKYIEQAKVEAIRKRFK